MTVETIYTTLSPYFPQLAWILITISLICVYLLSRHRNLNQQYPIHPPHPPLDPWTQSPAMEKANTPKTRTKTIDLAAASPPPASACDVLRPLSQSSSWPSSGSIAAKVREQKQKQAAVEQSQSPSINAPESTLKTHTDTTTEMTDSAQRRSETVLQMNVGGVRTWRRLVAQYS